MLEIGEKVIESCDNVVNAGTQLARESVKRRYRALMRRLRLRLGVEEPEIAAFAAMREQPVRLGILNAIQVAGDDNGHTVRQLLRLWENHANALFSLGRQTLPIPCSLDMPETYPDDSHVWEGSRPVVAWAGPDTPRVMIYVEEDGQPCWLYANDPYMPAYSKSEITHWMPIPTLEATD